MAKTGFITDGAMTKTVAIDTDLSDKEGYAVNWETTGDEIVNIAADASAPPFPLCEGADGSSTATIGTIAYGGEARVKLGGTVTAGAKLTSDANGKWVATTTDTDHYGAIARADGVANDLIPALVVQGMVAG